MRNNEQRNVSWRIHRVVRLAPRARGALFPRSLWDVRAAIQWARPSLQLTRRFWPPVWKPFRSTVWGATRWCRGRTVFGWNRKLQHSSRQSNLQELVQQKRLLQHLPKDRKGDKKRPLRRDAPGVVWPFRSRYWKIQKIDIKNKERLHWPQSSCCLCWEEDQWVQGFCRVHEVVFVWEVSENGSKRRRDEGYQGLHRVQKSGHPAFVGMILFILEFTVFLKENIMNYSFKGILSYLLSWV